MPYREGLIEKYRVARKNCFLLALVQKSVYTRAADHHPSGIEYTRKDFYFSYQMQHCIDFELTFNLPKTLIKTPPSNIGCASTAVIIRSIF